MSDLQVPAIQRLRGRRAFETIMSGGVRAQSGRVAVSWRGDEQVRPPRVGFAVPRSVGSAVARNQVRRRLRALCRARVDLPAGDYLIRIRPGPSPLDHATLGRQLDTSLARLDRLARRS